MRLKRAVGNVSVTSPMPDSFQATPAQSRLPASLKRVTGFGRQSRLQFLFHRIALIKWCSRFGRTHG